MKAGHRVEGLAPPFLVQQVARAEPDQARFQVVGKTASGQPFGALDVAEIDFAGEPILAGGPNQPLPEPRDGRQGGEGANSRHLGRELVHHLLDEEVAERNADEAAPAIADGIEHRGVGLEVRLHRPEDQILHRARKPLAQGDLDEDEGLVGEGGMEEPEAAPVRLEATLKILPIEDLVYRLVLDDLLEHEGGRAPVDAAKLKEPAVEPGAQQVEEVLVERLELRDLRQRLEQRLAHCEEIGHAVGRGVEEAEQLAARRLDRPRERGRRLRTGRRPIAFDRRIEGGRVRAEIMGEKPEEIEPAALVEPGERVEGPAREGDHRRFAPGAEQGPADLADVIGRLPRGRPGAPGHESPARAPDARHDLLPEGAANPHDGAAPRSLIASIGAP